VLVIDRVEFAVVDEVAYVRRLDHGDAGVLQQNSHAVDHTGQIRHVGEYVVGVNDVCCLPFAGQRFGEGPPKKLFAYWHTYRARYRSRSGRWIDA
jgi:hypothetical protein